MTSAAVEVFAWGKDWSPIIVVNTGSIMTLVYYPHKATGDVIITHRQHPAHCCICDEDIVGTRPHTRKAYAQTAFIAHLKLHGRRTRKRNGAITQMEQKGQDDGM